MTLLAEEFGKRKEPKAVVFGQQCADCVFAGTIGAGQADDLWFFAHHRDYTRSHLCGTVPVV